MHLRSLLAGVALFSSFVGYGQTLGFYGGAGASYDGFLQDKNVNTVGSSKKFLPTAMAVAGLRYHTTQSFDVILDATLGISRIELPVTKEANTRLQYEQIESLVMIGSGLSLPVKDKATVMPYIQIGAGFFDYWDLVEQRNDSYYSSSYHTDMKTNHWSLACAAGIDYQFKLFLSSGLNFRCVYTPMNIFETPIGYSIDTRSGTTDYKAQGKLLQFQLTYRVNLPIAKWKDNYDY